MDSLAIKISLLLALLLSASIGTAQADDPLLRVRIDAAEAPALAVTLRVAGFDVVEDSADGTGVDVVCSRGELDRLAAQGYAVRVIAEGRPFREIQDERAARAAAPPEGYPDREAIVAQLYATAAQFPAIAQVVNVTTTYGLDPTFEGRDLLIMKISDGVAVDEDEPGLLLVSGHHAREVVTPVVALHAIEQLTQRYGSDPSITELVDGHEIWIAPSWNPDGYEYVFNVDNLWRKNRRVFTEGIGVDQNRNYPFGWSTACGGNSDPASNTYRGPSAASEPETQAMMALSEDRHFAKVMDYHSSGREVLWSYACLSHPLDDYLAQEAIALSVASGYGGDNRAASAEGEHYEWQLATHGSHAFLIETASEWQPDYDSALAEAAQVFEGLIHQLQRPIPLTGHVTDATLGDPVVTRVRYPGLNFQNGETNVSEPRFGRYHAFLPPGEITVEFSADGYITQLHDVTIEAGVERHLDVQLVPRALLLELLSGPSGIVSPDTTPEIWVKIAASEEALLPGSAQLVFRYADGAFASTPLASVGGDVYRAFFPPVRCADVHDYYVVAVGDAGTFVTLPAAAPNELFRFDSGDPLALIAGSGTWHYFEGVEEPSPADPTAWTGVGFDDAGWPSGPGGFGHGDDCAPYGTLLSGMQGSYASLYTRYGFQIADPTEVSALELTIDYDDSFVAYVNGVEVARDNVTGTPPPFDQLSVREHECSGAPDEANPPQVIPLLGVAASAGLLVPGTNFLAIQAHNDELESDDFTLWATLDGIVCDCASTIPAEVVGLRVNRLDDGSDTAELTWQDLPGNPAYNLYRSEDAEGGWDCMLPAAVENHATDDGTLPAPGSVTYFLVTAVNCAGESTPGENRPTPTPCF